MSGAKREAEEETGLEIKIINFRGNYPIVKKKKNKILHQIKIIYNAKLTGKKVSKSENLPYIWLSQKQITSQKFEFWDNNILDIIM
jgi:8-oxo-dGTP pyrophosphatase MutT (NUDIX family)